MKLKDVLHALTEYVDRLMREIDPQPPQLMAPERSMTSPRSAPEEQPVTFELRRPWDVGEKKPPARPRSRSRDWPRVTARWRSVWGMRGRS